MNSVDFWTCLLSREAGGREFWHWSKVNKASAAACKVTRHVVARKLSTINLRQWGWSYSLKTPKELLHGCRGQINDRTGAFQIQQFSYGQFLQDETTEAVAYHQEPDDIPEEARVQMRRVSDHHAQRQWRRWLASLPWCVRKDLPDNPPEKATVADVVLISGQTIA